MMVLKQFFCLFVILLISYRALAAGKACAGHTVVIKKVEDCNGFKNPHFHIINCTVHFNDDCEVIPRFCFKWKKMDIDTVEYDVNRKTPPFNKKGTVNNLCEELENKNMLEAKKTYPVMKPFSCRLSKVKEGVRCVKEGRSKVNVPAIAWGFAKGIIEGRVFAYNSTTPDVRSCVDFEVWIDHGEGKRKG